MQANTGAVVLAQLQGSPPSQDLPSCEAKLAFPSKAGQALSLFKKHEIHEK